MNPKVSIGMPVYNGEKYIREAVNSLLSQNFVDFELIISDNASTDKTQEICEQYVIRDPRVIYIRQPINIGAISNFSFVRDQARGEYFMWAAADDIWDVNWLSKLYSLIVTKEKSIAVFGQVKPINSDSIEIKHIALGLRYKFSGFRWFRRLFFYLNDESAGKANLFYSLYRTELLKDVNLKDHSYDYSIIYDLLFKINYLSVKDVFFYKRDHSEAIGSFQKSEKNKIQWLIRQIFPLPKLLFLEYFRLSKWHEKLLIILFLPIKILFAYSARIKFLFLKS